MKRQKKIIKLGKLKFDLFKNILVKVLVELENNNLDDASEIIDNFIELFPRDEYAKRCYMHIGKDIGLRYLRNNQLSKSKEIFESILLVDYDEQEVLYYLGLVCRKMGLNFEAELEFLLNREHESKSEILPKSKDINMFSDEELEQVVRDIHGDSLKILNDIVKKYDKMN